MIFKEMAIRLTFLATSEGILTNIWRNIKNKPS